MATVAHEGNPRNTPDLVVSGTLDGSATLLLEFPVQNPARPIASDAGTFPTKVISTCGDVFNWARDDGRPEPIYLSEAPCKLSDGDHIITFDVHTEIELNPHTNCYGIIQSTAPGQTSTPEFLEWYSTYLGLVAGYPHAGPCFMSSHDGTTEVVTCYAIIPDFLAGTASLVKFTAASLSSIANATVLYSASYIPAVGDTFYFQSWQPGSFTAIIYDKNGTGLSNQKWTTDDLGLTVTNTATVGFVAIGNSNGTVLFGHNNQDCNHTPTLRVQNDATV